MADTELEAGAAHLTTNALPADIAEDIAHVLQQYERITFLSGGLCRQVLQSNSAGHLSVDHWL